MGKAKHRLRAAAPAADRSAPEARSPHGSPDAGADPENDAARWYVYLVRCRNGTLYTGIATDVQRRLAEHTRTNGRGARYLRGREPLELVLARPAGNRAVALRVEHRIKKLTRAAKQALLAEAHRVDRIVVEETERAAAS